MTYKINNTTVIDDSRNVCACCVCSCCVSATTQMIAPSGATGSRPVSPAAGSLYFDTTEGNLVAYSGTEWVSAGGGSEVVTNYIEAGSKFTAGWAGGGDFCTKEIPCAMMYPLPNGGLVTFANNPCTGTGFLCALSCSLTSWRTIKSYNPDGSVHKSGFSSRNTSYPLTNTAYTFRYVPYCGINDTNVEASAMMIPGQLCGSLCICEYTPFFMREGYWVSRRIGDFNCLGLGSCITASGVAGSARLSLFNITNYIPNASNSYDVSYGDACCGLIIRNSGTQFCNTMCCLSSFNTSMMTGFKPCYFYSTATCADAASSPIKLRVIRHNNVGQNGDSTTLQHVKIDWCNKKVWMLTGINPGCTFGQVSIWCICDRGFPNDQSCWCWHTPALSAYIFCLNNVSMNACMRIPNNVSFFNKNRTELVVGTCNGDFAFLPCASNLQVRYGQFRYCVAAALGCSMRLRGGYIDHCNCLRVIMTGRITSSGCNCFGSVLTEFVWNSACDITATAPVKAYEFRFACCFQGHTRTFCIAVNNTMYDTNPCCPGFGPPFTSFEPVSCKATYFGLGVRGFPDNPSCCHSLAYFSWTMPPIPTNCTINTFIVPLSRVPHGLYVCTPTNVAQMCTTNPPTTAGAWGWLMSCQATSGGFAACTPCMWCSGIPLCANYVCVNGCDFNAFLDQNSFSQTFIDLGAYNQETKLCDTLPW